MHIRAAEVFGRNFLTGRGLYQRGAAEEDGALLAHDDGFIGHGRDISAARCATAHDGGDLGDTLRAHLSLVVEDAAEMFAVGEDFGLVGQVRAAAVDEVDARQMVFHRHFLCPQVLFHGDGEIGPAFHGRVIADDQAFPALDAADASDQSGAGRFAVIHAVRRQGADLEKGAAGVDQLLDPLAGEELAAFGMALAAVLRASEGGFGGLCAQFRNEGGHGLPVGRKLRRGHVQGRFQNRHTPSP